MDPAVIKTVKQGACMQVTRLAEKSLAGVARATYVHTLADERVANEGGHAENDYPAASHALLLIEDPETGKYFLGDFRFRPPYMGPHTGNTVVDCVLLREDESLSLPSKLPWKLLKTQTIADMIAAPLSPKSSAVMLYTASSRCGKDKAQYEAWLKSTPPEFKELADKLNRSTK